MTLDAEGKNCARFTNLIAEPDAAEAAITEVVNDTLKAIAASLGSKLTTTAFLVKHP